MAQFNGLYPGNQYNNENLVYMKMELYFNYLINSQSLLLELY